MTRIVFMALYLMIGLGSAAREYHHSDNQALAMLMWVVWPVTIGSALYDLSDYERSDTPPKAATP